MNVQGAVFIITGSATGLGAEVAHQLAAKGGRVVINYTRSEAEAKAAAEACRAAGGEAILCQADVSVDDDCRRMAQTALDQWGRIDGLVNNAATSVIVPHHDLEGLASDDFRRVLDVNVVGAFQMARAVTPAMQQQGKGAIVNVSSGSGFQRLRQFHCLRRVQSRAERDDLLPGPRPGAGDPSQRRVPRRNANPLVARRLGRRLRGVHRAVRSIRPTAKPPALRKRWPTRWCGCWRAREHVTGETILVDAGSHLGPSPRR